MDRKSFETKWGRINDERTIFWTCPFKGPQGRCSVGEGIIIWCNGLSLTQSFHLENRSLVHLNYILPLQTHTHTQQTHAHTHIYWNLVCVCVWEREHLLAVGWSGLAFRCRALIKPSSLSVIKSWLKHSGVFSLQIITNYTYRKKLPHIPSLLKLVDQWDEDKLPLSSFTFIE